MLTSLDIDYIFREAKKKLKQKGYKVNIMGLIIKTDDNGIKVFANEKEGANGKFMTYSLGISKKDQNGNWVTGYMSCRFKKGVTVANKTRIKIKSAFFMPNKSGGKTYVNLMITDFEVIESGETAAESADEFMAIPEGADDEVPFL